MELVIPGPHLAVGLRKLSRFFCEARDKAFALIWQIFLIAGPSPESVRDYFDSVCCVVSDMGVEMGLVDAPDIIDYFFFWMATGKHDPTLVEEGRANTMDDRPF